MNRIRKTKIVCTLGPATDDDAVLERIIKGGMNVARFNFSHGTHEQHKERMDQLKRVRDRLGEPVAIMLDTSGPEVRLGLFEGGKVSLTQGQKFVLTSEQVTGSAERVSVTHKSMPSEVHSGTHILIDDGKVELKVEHVEGNDIICTVLNGASLSDRKSVNVPGCDLNIPYVSEKDMSDLLFGIENDIDLISASFARSAEDMLEIRRILEQHGGGDIKIIAKIENRRGVDNIDEILRAANGIMVARGDMGMEIPMDQLPHIQKMLIKKAYTAGKSVITATQLLESMINNPRPLRAEVTDIANAVYDGTSAVMLSGETAMGKYPAEAVETMARIILTAEADIDYAGNLSRAEVGNVNVTDAISHATCTTAHDLEAAAIITVTKSGGTARMISRFRPACPIIGCATDERTRRQLNLSWGVVPVMSEEKETTDLLFEHAVHCAVETGIVGHGDLVVLTAGVPLGVSGTTNILKVHVVGDMLVSGIGTGSLRACGNLCVCKSEEEALAKFREGDILVLPFTTNNVLRIMKKAKGIITEEEGLDSHAAIVGQTLDIPVITGAANATYILKSGTTVTLDGGRGIVYSGVVSIGYSD